jgi:hypothetical protein
MLDLDFDFNQKTILGDSGSDCASMLIKFFNMLNDFALEGNISIYQALVEFQLGCTNKKPIEDYVIRYVRDRVALREQSERALTSLKQIFSAHESVRCREPAYQRLRAYVVHIVQTRLMAEAVAHDQAKTKAMEAKA